MIDRTSGPEFLLGSSDFDEARCRVTIDKSPRRRRVFHARCVFAPPLESAKILARLLTLILQGTPEGKRMVSGFIGNEVPRKGLRVRVPCPPLKKKGHLRL